MKPARNVSHNKGFPKNHQHLNTTQETQQADPKNEQTKKTRITAPSLLSGTSDLGTDWTRLLRFFEEESTGIKVSPQLVLIVGAGMLVFVLVAQRLWPLAASAAAAILAALL